MTCMRPSRDPVGETPEPSQGWVIGGPILAVLLTMVAGGAMFALLGADPVEAMRDHLLGPAVQRALRGLLAPAAAGQGGAADPDRDRAVAGVPRGHLEHRGRGAIHRRRAVRGRLRAGLLALGVIRCFSPAWCWRGFGGGFLWAIIPAVLKVYARHQRDPRLAPAGLCRRGDNWPGRDGMVCATPKARAFRAAGTSRVIRAPTNPELIAGTGMHWGVLVAFVAVIAAYVLMNRHILGYQIKLAGQAPRAARFRRREPRAAGDPVASASRARWPVPRACSRSRARRGRSPSTSTRGYGFTAIIVAFLGRLNPIGILLAGLLIGADLHRAVNWRNCFWACRAPSIQAFQGMLLFFLLALDVLANYRVRWGREVAA